MNKYIKSIFFVLILSIFLINAIFAIYPRDEYDLKTKLSLNPTTPDLGDIVELDCKITNLGNIVKFESIDLRFYMLVDDDEVEEYERTYDDLYFYDDSDDYTYTHEFELLDEYENSKVTFGCEITDSYLDNEYDKMSEANTNNDISEIDLNTDSLWNSNGIDLGIYKISINEDDDLYPNQEIDITCTYANYGDKTARDDDGEIKLYWLVNDDIIETQELTSVSANTKKNKTFAYTIPSDYYDTEIKFGCKIKWSPEDSDDKDTERDNDKKSKTYVVDLDDYSDYYNTNYYNTNTSTINSTINNTYPNIVMKTALISTPMIVNQTNNITCKLQNQSTKSTSANIITEIYVDNYKIYEKTITSNLSAYDTYTFESGYKFNTIGNYLIKCNAKYLGTETISSDNYLEQTYYIIKNTSNTNTIINTKTQATPRVNSITINSRSSTKTNLTCFYSNTGNAEINNYTVQIIQNDLVINTEKITTPLLKGESTTYTKEVDTGYDASTIGCKVIFNNLNSVKYTSIDATINYLKYSIIIGAVILALLIIYLIVRH